MGGDARVGGADDTDAEGGVDRVRETKAVTNCWTILCSAQADGEVVLCGGRRATNFEGPDVAL